jgi:hypothetical protein
MTAMQIVIQKWMQSENHSDFLLWFYDNKELLYEIDKLDMLDMYEKGYSDAKEQKEIDSISYYKQKLK